MEIKLSSTDEAARDPHNVVAAFAGQCGIPAGLLMAAALIYPLMLLWKHRFDRSWQCAVFWSGLFFTLHILMDCDFHIPAIMAGILLLYFSALPPPCGELSRKSGWMLPLFAGFAILAGAGNIYFLRGEIKLAEFTDFLNPGDVNTRSRYAGVSMEKVESDAAQARPGLALIPELAGDYFFANGDLERAHERYLKALMLNPRRPGIYRRLARLACRKGNFDDGVKLLKKAHGLFPRNPKYSLEHPDNRLMFPVDFNFTVEDVK
jgi:tetratricopeptide (TPR) repeat protein